MKKKKKQQQQHQQKQHQQQTNKQKKDWELFETAKKISTKLAYLHSTGWVPEEEENTSG
jgi:hypothetical protein